MPVELDQVPRVHREAGVERLEGRLLVLTQNDEFVEFVETSDGGKKVVNEVGERIMELVDGKRTVRDIVRVLCEEFEVEPAQCESDTVRFVGLLVEKQVLEI